MDNEIIDQATAQATLYSLGSDLSRADDLYHEATDDLREAILDIRPTGVVSVPQMASAIGKQRNYIDTLWSGSGRTVRDDDGRVVQTRLGIEPGELAEQMLDRLEALSDRQIKRHANARVIRARRDQAVVVVYTSKILGPTAIAAHLGIDRNHVLRIVRKAGVSPAHRTNIRNQHTMVRDPTLDDALAEATAAVPADVTA